jgi:uncharacterized membrane-anchored protein
MNPADHALRRVLNDEVHARPPEQVRPPVRLSYLALIPDEDRAADIKALHDLVTRYGAPAPRPDQNHYSADLGPFRIKWERHTEFLRYKFFVNGAEAKPFSTPAIMSVPQEWLGALPGKVISAYHAVLLPEPAGGVPVETMADSYFNGNALIGSMTSGGKGLALTDFRIHDDGFGRLMIFDSGLTPRQMGRLVQRIMEIDTYRMMALLAFPVARSLGPQLQQAEQELLAIIDAMQVAKEEDEPLLFDRITKLEAQVEKARSDTHFRFSAAVAYHTLVEQRVDELREQRIEGLQTFREFNERRLSPAMATCRTTSARLEAILDRVGRTTMLLSTRVNVTREKQNQQVLKSMDRRATMQLRLQQTVEGLSVAAISYYIVGLVGYAAKGIKASGRDINLDLVTAWSIPVVIGLVAFGLYRFRRAIEMDDDK